jgi:hypothetical protein
VINDQWSITLRNFKFAKVLIIGMGIVFETGPIPVRFQGSVAAPLAKDPIP